ncbi:MAG: PIG-L deacetylase family protein, partial [Terracoccus sp.]
MTAQRGMIPVSVTEPPTGLPAWHAVLAVVAHPDGESFGLGAILDAFATAGTHTTVLCLTRGEASTIHGVSGDLTAVRASELEKAARALGVSATELADHPDGALADVDRDVLAAEVASAATRHDAEGLLVFDPSGISGHPDHVAATGAAMNTAEHDGLPVLAWTLPRAVAHQLNEEF